MQLWSVACTRRQHTNGLRHDVEEMVTREAEYLGIGKLHRGSSLL